ncbi:espin-like isoform X1 [Haliotis rufescens]|uniref:espin-like isoform X1 n=2 Tax=Haliotis rufescens TaxID=6454 RepID=UPI00201EEDA1|nr:espin-like isoform X1 [Haliotis rufescens]
MVANRALEAAKSGDIAILQSLAEPAREADKHGATCLHYAARGGNVKTIEFLVKKKGFNAIKRSNVGATPAHDAAATGNLAALKWILENTECKVDDQDGTGATVLHLGTRYGHAHIVSYLLDDTNCDIMKKTATGAMPLHFAVVGGNLDIVKMLVKEAPRSVNLQMNNGVTAVYLSCQSGLLDILKFLVLTANGSLKISSFDGMTILHAAAQNGHLSCVQWLIAEQKCNPNERDLDGVSALHFAASRSHHQVVEWLLKHGGRVTLDNLGGSPLHNAAEMGHKQCIQVLLDNGCDRNITDNKGLTAAELADKCNQPYCAAQIRGEVTLQPQSAQPPPAVPSTSNGAPERRPQPSGFQGYRPTRPVSVASSCSDFGYYTSREAARGGRQITVHAEVHTNKKLDNSRRLSKETGEPECVLQPGKRSSAHRSPSPSSLRPPSPPVSPPYNGRNRGSVVSELSSTASTLSSLSASASREFEESDAQDGRVKAPSPQRVPFSAARARFEGRPPTKYDTVRSCDSCEESGETIPTHNISSWRYSELYARGRNVVIEEKEPSDNMASPREATQNGGSKKTVIQIRGSTIRIDDGTGSRDIKTHSRQNGNVTGSAPVKSSQPKLIMTMTPSPADLSAKSTATSTVNGSAANGQMTNGSISPRNSVGQSVVKTQSSSSVSENKTVTTSNGVTNGSASASRTTVTNGSSMVKHSAPHPGRPVGFSPLGSIMMSALPPKVTPHASDVPASQQNSPPSPPLPPPPPPVEDRTPSPSNTNIKPSSLSGGAFQNQNGFVKSAPPRFDLIAELQSGPGKSGLKTSKGPNRGATMVFSFGNGNMAAAQPQPSQPKQAPAGRLDGEFDPKNFLDQVPERDSSGQPIPQWKKQMLAKGIAEKTQKEAEARRKVEAEEARFRNVPAWKRALIEKKETTSKNNEVVPAPAKPVTVNNTTSVDEDGRPLTSWQTQLRKKKGVVN